MITAIATWALGAFALLWLRHCEDAIFGPRPHTAVTGRQSAGVILILVAYLFLSWPVGVWLRALLLRVLA